MIRSLRFRAQMKTPFFYGFYFRFFLHVLVFVSFRPEDGKPQRKRRLSGDTMTTVRSAGASPSDEVLISSSTSSPPPRPPSATASTAADPVLEERCNSEELRHASCRLETKDLWDKFNDLGTEMIITKTGRSVVPYVYYTIRRLDKWWLGASAHVPSRASSRSSSISSCILLTYNICCTRVQVYCCCYKVKYWYRNWFYNLH